MIVDCFPFFNELDLLEIRLNELAGVVDKFVLTEATLTHSGKAKPLFFDNNKHRFKDYPIEHIIIHDYTNIDLSWPWNLEHHQRDVGVQEALIHHATHPDDILISSDADEIPSATAVQRFKESGQAVMSLDMGLYYYYMNCYCPKRPWWYPKIFHPAAIAGKTASNLRKKHHHIHRLKPGGWHFSYLNDIAYKIDSFAHQERNLPQYTNQERIEHIKDTLRDLYDRNRKYPFTLLTDLSYLPQYVQSNLPRFQHYLKVPND